MGGMGLEDCAGAAPGGQEAGPRVQGSQRSQTGRELWRPARLYLPSPWEPRGTCVWPQTGPEHEHVGGKNRSVSLQGSQMRAQRRRRVGGERVLHLSGGKVARSSSSFCAFALDILLSYL